MLLLLLLLGVYFLGGFGPRQNCFGGWKDAGLCHGGSCISCTQPLRCLKESVYLAENGNCNWSKEIDQDGSPAVDKLLLRLAHLLVFMTKSVRGPVGLPSEFIGETDEGCRPARSGNTSYLLSIKYQLTTAPNYCLNACRMPGMHLHPMFLECNASYCRWGYRIVLLECSSECDITWI